MRRQWASGPCFNVLNSRYQQAALRLGGSLTESATSILLVILLRAAIKQTISAKVWYSSSYILRGIGYA